MIYPIEPAFTPEQLARITSGELRGAMYREPVSSLSIDSREQNPAGLFLCIAGERFDGHDYIADAAKNGAICVITERDAPTNGLCEIRVHSTERALGDIAAACLRQKKAQVVAVTGSVGKTTTKQFLSAVISQHYRTHCTKGNFNNQIGVPLTVLDIRPEHEAAVLELGMNHSGEIARLSEIVHPHIGIITNIGNSHIEYLGSREGIRDAKMEITTGMGRDDILILNGDEPLLAGVEGAVYVALDDPTAQYRVCSVELKTDSAVFSLHCPDRVLEGLTIPVTGRHCVFDAAFACVAGLLMGIEEEEIRRGLLSFANTGMRQNITEENGVTLIEDCYNASPESMRAAIDVLHSLTQAHGGRAIAILGDMRELGEHAPELHRAVGSYLAQQDVSVLFTFGEDAVMIAVGAMESGLPEDSIYVFRCTDDTAQIGNTLRRVVQAGDTVLLKASRALEMERLLPYLKTK